MVFSSGNRFLDKNTVLSMTQHIFPLANLVTPNIPEAAALLGKE
jgi:hydroxymethylpyrimidine/phosphomethylpyrimidine kinase